VGRRWSNQSKYKISIFDERLNITKDTIYFTHMTYYKLSSQFLKHYTYVSVQYVFLFTIYNVLQFTRYNNYMEPDLLNLLIFIHSYVYIYE